MSYLGKKIFLFVENYILSHSLSYVIICWVILEKMSILTWIKVYIQSFKLWWLYIWCQTIIFLNLYLFTSNAYNYYFLKRNGPLGWYFNINCFCYKNNLQVLPRWGVAFKSRDQLQLKGNSQVDYPWLWISNISPYYTVKH